VTLAEQLLDEVDQLVGLHAPSGRVVAVTDADGIELAVDFSAVDRMSCAFRELRLRVPSLAGCGTDLLEAWAAELSARITYLLENVGPVEVDTKAGKVLVRSTPPTRQAGGTEYFEVLLESDTKGNFTLRRYRADRGTPGRKWVDVTTTHEVLRRLATDLVETIPAP
jgi:hypothetical protein